MNLLPDTSAEDMRDSACEEELNTTAQRAEKQEAPAEVPMAESASAHKMQAEEEASPEETGDVMEAPRDKVEATKDAEVVFSKSEEETRAAEGEDQARELTDEIPLETIA